MFEVDHVAVWLTDRDAVLAELSAATSLPVLEGYAPDGRRVARGLRFANGPFLDLHQAEIDGPGLLALRGAVRTGEAVAIHSGWRATLTLHEASGEPWSILSFARKQGLLSRLFVIQYEPNSPAWASPVFNGGLYDRPPDRGALLTAVRLTTSDPDRTDADLRRLGFSARPGGRYSAGAVDLILSEGDDAISGLEIEGGGPPCRIKIGQHLTVCVGAESIGLTTAFPPAI